jgi:hypothetical protein
MDHVIAATSAPAPAAKPDLGSSQWEPVAAAASNIVFAVAAVALAIFKPGGRLRRPRVRRPGAYAGSAT